MVIALFAAACSRRTPTPTIDAGPAPAAIASSSPREAEAPPSRIQHHSRSLASFHRDMLDECVDVSADVTPPPDAGANWKPKADVLKAFLSDTKGGAAKKTTELAGSCAENFGDRIVLATCRLSLEIPPDKETKGASATFTALSSYYDYGTVGVNDSYMRDCLKAKGQWHAEPRTSDTWQRAKLEYDAQRLRRLTGQ